MASKHYLKNGLLAACVLATAGIGIMEAQARSTNGNDGVRITNPLPAVRSVERARGADFSENFDAYAVGSNVHGQGGWKGWFNDPNAGAFVDDAFSSSASNSINISTTSDLVHEFDQASGVWIVRAMQYIPGDYAGQSYFIMQNAYDDAGANLNWSVQVQFDSATGTVLNDGGVSGGSMSYVTDEWVEIRVEIDLDNNIQSFFYDGTLLYSGSWTDQFAPGAGVLEIGAIDLFANGASPVYYDDITIAEEGGAPFAVSLAADPVASDGAPGSTVTYSVTVDNTGTTDDTYDLAAAGVWTAATSVPTIAVTAGASATFDVTVDVPASATLGDSDVTTITATSQGDPQVEATVDVTTTAAVDDLIFADGFDPEDTGDPDIVTGEINLPVANDFDGSALDLVTGTYLPYNGARVDDINLYNGGDGLYVYWYADAVPEQGGVSTDGVTFDVLQSGATIGPASTFLGASIALTANWWPGADGYFGIAFMNEETSEVNYGYIHVTTTAADGFPAQTLEYAYNSAGNSITIP